MHEDYLTRQFGLHGKTALVTGGYRGLGLAISIGLASAGARVVLNGRSREAVEEQAEKLRAEGLEIESAVFDITDEEQVEEAVKRLAQRHGNIDILVNNAGVQRRHPLASMPLAEFKAVLDVNLTAAFLVARSVVEGMHAQGSGKIINICSLMSDLARPTTGNYAAAKGGLRMLTRSMAGEWASEGIQVNAIAPGYFETEMTKKLKEDPQFNEWICGRTPAGRWGQPSELAGLAVFLASPASSYINGQMVFADGGLTAVI
ncbi:MAG: glucose 1-dehydrogenase [Verrucomicrobia bacterium]|jgi:gluconate 5-dehydrogenase|nr:glucose 1-dehydrogenase [Verrucomicrobiota bacterium]